MDSIRWGMTIECRMPNLIDSSHVVRRRQSSSAHPLRNVNVMGNRAAVKEKKRMRCEKNSLLSCEWKKCKISIFASITLAYGTYFKQIRRSNGSHSYLDLTLFVFVVFFVWKTCACFSCCYRMVEMWKLYHIFPRCVWRCCRCCRRCRDVSWVYFFLRRHSTCNYT